MKPKKTENFQLTYMGLDVSANVRLDIITENGYYIESVLILNSKGQVVFHASPEQCVEIQADNDIQKQIKDFLKIEGNND